MLEGIWYHDSVVKCILEDNPFRIIGGWEDNLVTGILEAKCLILSVYDWSLVNDACLDNLKVKVCEKL